MPTRDLQKNSKLSKLTDRIERVLAGEIDGNYNDAVRDIRSKLVELYETFGVTEDMSKAQLAQFVRVSNLIDELDNVVQPYVQKNIEALTAGGPIAFEASFFKTAWAMDTAVGVPLEWNLVNPNSVVAAQATAGDFQGLARYLPPKEIDNHSKILDKAFKNYTADTRRWIGEAANDAIQKGKSIQQVSKEIRDKGIVKSKRHADMIARTEVLRASTIGNQIAAEQARENGVAVREVWDATLDDRTRPDHAAADGTVRDATTGLFSVPWGQVTGPHQSGIASQDISCRCVIVETIDGYEPELRRIRGEGLKPYQTFETWATEHGFTANKYGQKYDFITR